MKNSVIPKRMVCQTALLVGASLFSTVGAYAETIKLNANVTQQREIVVKGVVKDKTGETIPGANIVVKGTTNGTVTDIDGNFSLSVPANGTLEVSYIGYKSQEIAVGNQTTLDIVLASNVEELDEVVVTALGIKREKESLRLCYAGN